MIEVRKSDVLRISSRMRAMVNKASIWSEKLPRLNVVKYVDNILELFEKQDFAPLSPKYLKQKAREGKSEKVWEYNGRFLDAVKNPIVTRIRAGSFGVDILASAPDIAEYVAVNEARRPILRPAAEKTIRESSDSVKVAALEILMAGGGK